MSRFRLSIVDAVSGSQALLIPGGREERDLIEETVTRTLERGVGFLKTESQVAEAVRAAMVEVLTAAKRDVRAPSRVFTGQNSLKR